MRRHHRSRARNNYKGKLGLTFYDMVMAETSLVPRSDEEKGLHDLKTSVRAFSSSSPNWRAEREHKKRSVNRD